MAIHPFVSFLWLLLASTTTKKSPSPLVVEVLSSLKSTLRVTPPLDPPPSNNVPAVTPVISPVQVV